MPPGNVDVDPGPRHGLFLLVHRVGIAGDNAHIVFADGIQKCFVEIRIHQVVRIHKADVIPAGIVQPNVQSGGRATVFLVEHPDAVILPGQLIAESRGAVGAAVIHQQQLPVGKGLPPHALHAVSEKFLRLIDRHNDGNAGHRQPPCALRRLSSVCGAETPAPSPQNLGLLHGAIVPDFPGKVNVFSRKSRAY